MGNDGVSAVEKALSLLDCFKAGQEEMSLTALSIASGIPVTTTYRMMNSLERMRYVVRSEAGIYSLGHRLLYLGKLYERSFKLSSIVEPALRALSNATGMSASYSIVQHAQYLCLFRADPAEGLRLTWTPGVLRPFDSTAASDVLRFWSAQEPSDIPPPSIPIFKSGARDVHTAASSTPIFGAGDKFIAALTLSGAASSFEAAHADSALRRTQLEAAANLSRRLGASGALCERMYAAR